MPANPWPLFSLLSLSTALLTASAVTPRDQTQALLLWKTTHFRSAPALSSWDSSRDNPCQWFGVSCNSRNEVEELNLRHVDLLGSVPSNFTSLASLRRLVLSGANLTGRIPREVGILRELSHLDLSQNSLASEIPAEICYLTHLRQLHLNSNQLRGAIPVGIGNLSSLTRLLLFDNHISGVVPGSVGRLRELETIRAGGNKDLGGALPPEIGNCSSLVLLGLAATSISGRLPASLGLLGKLRTLAIYTALLSGPIPPELGHCGELQDIYLYENSLTGSIPNRLGRLGNLRNLLLWQNHLEGTIPPEIGDCAQLTLVDITTNSLTGSIPETIGNLSHLRELHLSGNRISGTIPSQIGRSRAIKRMGFDNNRITGTIPSELGDLRSLTLLFLWQNKLEGSIPSSLSACRNLQAIDLSQNSLTGSIPGGIFQLQNLSELLLLSNRLSGPIPPEIGKCSSLIRFRAGSNRLRGAIPSQIGKLGNLNFLDLGSNQLTGTIPAEISLCRNLAFLDLHSNAIAGKLPENFSRLVSLQVLDVSNNIIGGSLSPGLGSLTSLTKFALSNNRLIGAIPTQLGSCGNLQLLDLSRNELSGEIPASLGSIPSLEIALNLSCNGLTGKIPAEFAALDKLGMLDLAHNHLSGDLHCLADLQNLVVLNVSHNNFSGRVPDTPFFSKFPPGLLAGNPSLCLHGGQPCTGAPGDARRRKANKLALAVLLSAACALLLSALYIAIATTQRRRGLDGSPERRFDDNGGMDMGPPWEVMLYQKLDLSIADVASWLTSGNVVGRGRSGVVYRATLPSGLTIAVKRFRSSEMQSAAAFSSERETLARIRHRNIIRLLGWGANREVKLLFYDFLPNGTLGAWLHEGRCSGLGEWETRFKIALGVAEGLAYLHHDCAPGIVHRDVKAHNILLGDACEPFLADFGLARSVDGHDGSISSSPQFAGSYGYIAPEYGSTVKITEKSDVYSYGVLLLEILTGKLPVDPSFSGGEQHVIQWVREQLRCGRDPVRILDPNLEAHPDTQIQEMLQTLGIALLCASDRAGDRPAMKDVAALLRGIRHDPAAATEAPKPGAPGAHSTSYSKTGAAPAARWVVLGGSSHGSLDYSFSSPPPTSRLP